MLIIFKRKISGQLIICNKTVEQVHHFKYLGTMINANIAHKQESEDNIYETEKIYGF